MKNYTAEKLTSIETRLFIGNSESARDDYLQQLSDIEYKLLAQLQKQASVIEFEKLQELLNAVNAGKQIVKVIKLRSEKLKQMRYRV